MEISYIWAKLLKRMQVSAKRRCEIHKDAKAEAGSFLYDTSMGRYSYCGYDCKIINATIGAFSSIADRVTIGGASHPQDWVSTSSAFYSGKDSISKRLAALSYDRPVQKTVIGNDVWIGDGAYIKAGVTVGHGAIIGMGSIVTKDVSPYHVVAGNPAAIIRARFDEQVIADLLNSKWWELDDNALKKITQYCNSPQIFLERMRL